MHIKIVKINSTPQINIKVPVPYVSSEYLGVRLSYKLVHTRVGTLIVTTIYLQLIH